LDGANHHSQKEGGLIRIKTRVWIEERKRAEDDKRNGVGWAVDQVG
jgi:hypothetical protein